MPPNYYILALPPPPSFSDGTGTVVVCSQQFSKQWQFCLKIFVSCLTSFHSPISGFGLRGHWKILILCHETGQRFQIFASVRKLESNFLTISVWSIFAARRFFSRGKLIKLQCHTYLTIFLLPLKSQGSPKLYIPSTLNIDLILWHTQLILCALKC